MLKAKYSHGVLRKGAVELSDNKLSFRPFCEESLKDIHVSTTYTCGKVTASIKSSRNFALYRTRVL